MPAGTRVTFEVASLAAGGDGVGRVDGLVVFTPRTAPGDRIAATVAVEGRVGRGTLLEIERPSPDRVAAACPHYEAPDRCGGCQWQHVALEAQREAKRRMVQDAFARIGRRTVALPSMRGGAPWRYRRALTLAIRRRGDRVWAGMRAHDDPEAVFALDDCQVTEPRVVETWRAILAAAAHLPAGARLRGTVRWLESEPGFVLEGGEAWPALKAFLAAVPSLGAVWWQAEGRRRQLVADRRAQAVPAASFAQVNAEVAAWLHETVVARALAFAPATAVDAYSGAGETAARLASAGVAVTAIELDAEASAFAAARLSAPSRAVAATVEAALSAALPADVVLLNPPRAGVAASVTDRLARPGRGTGTRGIVYVSCDPATLARDVGRLVGWQVASLECFDMFPQTAHVETVCVLEPA
ncbi:MAG: class I SAM-dependent RNA methyltransferase [Gemmatimonadetes bacterium]|nr:class I SAM-dependent RNA methyltransferase [Gemmatimonadota bacterium]